MSFNPDPSKQAQEVIFSRKIKKPSHPHLIFNCNQVIQTPYQKHLGTFLDDTFNFGKHLKYIADKVNKSFGLLRKIINYYRDDHWLLFTDLSLDLISTREP